MAQITPRDRFLAQLSGSPIARGFFWESGIWLSAVERWRKEGLNESADPYEALGLDRINLLSINCTPIPDLKETVLEEDNEWTLLEDEVGGKFRRSKIHFCPGTQEDPSCVYKIHTLRDRPSWEIIKGHLNPHEKTCMEELTAFTEGRDLGCAENSGLSRNFKPDSGLPTALDIMTGSYWLIRMAGFEQTALMLYDDRTLMDEVFEYLTWFYVEQLRYILAKRPTDVVVLNEGSAASKHGPFISPNDYSKLAGKHLRQLTTICRDAGVQFVFANSGGNIYSLIPIWKDVGINGLMPLDVSAGVDPVDIGRKYPDMALIGGVDRTALEGSQDSIEAALLQKARFLYNRGRSIPSGDAHFPISDRVSFDNMRFYVDTLKKAIETGE